MVIPLYQKISDDLKAQIVSQKIKVGDKLPTEMELSDTYNVSRITAKRALNDL
ncbi:MAG: GntR family transcriptional regulator, partial [Streptococcaceae bacterium]|nr:GntR family transcriptional regulator [Streptococcaceae bacterium]